MQSGNKDGRGDSAGIKRQIQDRKFVRKLNEGNKATEQELQHSFRHGKSLKKRHICPDRGLTGSRESELKRIAEQQGKNGTRDIRRSRQ